MDKTEFTVIESKAASEVKPEKEVKAIATIFSGIEYLKNGKELLK